MSGCNTHENSSLFQERENQLAQDWYRKERERLTDLFSKAKRSEKAPESFTSPSGKYTLKIFYYENGQFSRGMIRNARTEELIADVIRNFRHFPFSWCEAHPSGHDYLICGEDYQGQTIIELDTGERVDFIPDEAEQGVGFCWVKHDLAPDGKHLFIDGCVWACPYEMILYDFSKPLELPYQELNRWPVHETQGFQPDGSFRFDYSIEIRFSDGKPVDDFTDKEWDEYELDYNNSKLYGDQKIQVKWNPDGTVEETPVTD